MDGPEWTADGKASREHGNGRRHKFNDPRAAEDGSYLSDDVTALQDFKADQQIAAIASRPTLTEEHRNLLVWNS